MLRGATWLRAADTGRSEGTVGGRGTDWHDRLSGHDRAWAVGDCERSRLSDSVGLAVVGQSCGDRTVGGDGSDDGGGCRDGAVGEEAAAGLYRRWRRLGASGWGNERSVSSKWAVAKTAGILGCAG